MKPFQRPNKFGKNDGGHKRRKDFGRSNSGGGRDFSSDRRDFDQPRHRGHDEGLFQAICAQCGRECEVPFKPTGSRPVLCRDCFRQNEALTSNDGFSGGFGGGFGGNSYGKKPQRRFESNRGGGDATFAAELDNINRKIDQIMAALEIDE
jgi:CxxC-x17-CxxC domain-containing protein